MKTNTPTKLKRLKPVGRVSQAVSAMECKLTPVVKDKKLSNFRTLINGWEDKSANNGTVLTAAVLKVRKLEAKIQTANQGREDKNSTNSKKVEGGVIGHKIQERGTSEKIHQSEGGSEKIRNCNNIC